MRAITLPQLHILRNYFGRDDRSQADVVVEYGNSTKLRSFGLKRLALVVLGFVTISGAILVPNINRPISIVYAAAGVNNTVNIQGKVTNSNGTNVADGLYDMVFKLYNGADGTATNTFTESWTSAVLFSQAAASVTVGGSNTTITYSSDTNETSLKPGQFLWDATKVEAAKIVSVNTSGTGGSIVISTPQQTWATSDTITNRIYVKNGIFQVALNSLNADPAWGTTDFTQDTIYLGVNFNSDGEMKPRTQFTTVPYAFRAKSAATVDGLSVASGKTLTVSNSLTLAGTDGTTLNIGGNNITFTTSAATSLTLPSSGTLATLAGSEALTNKTINGLSITSTTGTLTVAAGKTLTANNSVAFSGTDGIAVNFGGNNLTLTTSGATNLTLPTSGTVCVTSSGCNQANTNTGSGAAGQVTFYTGTNTQAGSNSLFWSTGTSRLGINTAGSPGATLDVSSSETTANAAQINANSLTTGQGLSIASTSTSLTTGGLLGLSWVPGSATTMTGDLFSINVGPNGTVGNILNLMNDGLSVFSVSQSLITANVPVAFNAPGDFNLANGLYFSNTTQANISSAAPIQITSGEAFNSSNLTLSTYNNGMVVLDSGTTTTNGKIGVGTSSPTGQVHIKGTLSTALSGTIAVTNASAAVVGTSTSFTTAFNAGDAIGINGVAYTVLSITDATHLTLTANYAGSTASGLTAYSDGNALAIDNGAGTNNLTFTKSGRLGIGTNAPTQALAVVGNALISGNNNKLYLADGAHYLTYDGSNLQVQSAAGGININTSTAAPITFGINNGEQMRIDTTGNVGIGTSTGINSKLTFAASTTASGGILFGSDTNLYRAGANSLQTDGLLVSGVGLTAGSSAYATRASGDTNSRFYILNTGGMNWGPGNAATDTNLYRASAGVLKTDGAFQASSFNGLSITNNGSNTLNIAAGKTLTASNSISLSGADGITVNFGSNNLTWSTSGATSLTLPTTGTLATLAGSENLTNKSLNGLTITTAVATTANFTKSGDGVGGLMYSGSADTWSYLARGSNGQCLTSNATTILWGPCSSGGITGTGSAGQIAFFTGTSTQSSDSNFVWDNTNKRLGIGATPLSKLDVNGGVAIGSYAGNNAAPNNGLIVSGNVGIGTSNPTQKVEVAYGNLKFDTLSAPGAPTVASGAAGSLTGTYSYKVTFVSAAGETNAGTASANVSPSSQQVSITAIPTDSTGNATARKLYRTKAGGSYYYYLATISDNATTTYTDNIADGSLGADAPADNTSGGQLYVNSNRVLWSTTSNTALGTGSLTTNTSGTQNVAIGSSALGLNTTGASNTGLGYQALNTNTTGSDNTAIGNGALYTNTTGNSNDAFGEGALRFNTSGSNNGAFGSYSLRSNTTGNDNVALGGLALYGNTTGSYNTGLGFQAMQGNTIGTDNTAVGWNALFANTSGASNAAFGENALGSLKPTGTITAFAANGGNTTVTSNGHGLYNGDHVNISGTTNYNGSFYIVSNVTTNTFDINHSFVANDATGTWDSGTNGDASYNTALGYGAGMNNKVGYGNVFIGYESGWNELGSNKLYIANSTTSSPLIYGDFSAGSLTFNGNVAVGAGKTIQGLLITNNGTNTLNIAAGKTLTVSNSLTMTGTDGSSVAFGTGGTVCYTGTCAASSVRLDQITAATTTATIANGSNAIAWNWGSLTTQTGMSMGGGTAMTTGSVLALGSGTYVHTVANDTGSLAKISFTDASTNTNNGGVTNGLNIAATINTSGAGTKTINSINVTAPTLTACATGGCTVNGTQINTATAGAASTIIQNGLAIVATGVASGTLNGISIGSITGAAGAETAVAIGSGWDNSLTVGGSAILNGSGVLQSAGLSGTYSNGLTLSSSSNAFTGATFNGLAITSTTGTLTVASAKTLTASNTLTFTGTDGSSVAFGTGGTVCYTGTCAANAVRLDQITAATTTATIANGSNAIAWNWGSLTTQVGMTMGGGTAMTTGSVLGLGSATYTHTTAETGNLATISFTDTSTIASGTSITNGVNINATINATSGAGTRQINALNIASPTVTACSAGTCTKTAINIGSGWDNGLSIAGSQILNGSGVLQSAGLSGTYANNVTFSGTSIFGSSGNTITLSSSGLAYAGTARPTKTITLSAEYPGATLTTDGSGTTNGSMTSDNTGSTKYENYYQWSSTQAAVQDYTIDVRVQLPSDFSAWQTNAVTMDYQTGTATAADNNVNLTIVETAAGGTVYSTTNLNNTTMTTLTIANTSLTGGTAWNTAGQVVTFKIKLKADSASSALARVGDITLNYYRAN